MQALFDLLGRFSQPLLIIGGHALAAHGVVRQTVDVDCLISVKDRQPLALHLAGGGFKKVSETDNFARYSHSSEFVPDIDVLFVETPTFEKLGTDGKLLQRGGVGLRVPALKNLIALKLHAIRNDPAREAGDLGDIVRLLRANPRAVSAIELSALCARFGPAESAAKLDSLQTTP